MARSGMTGKNSIPASFLHRPAGERKSLRSPHYMETLKAICALGFHVEPPRYYPLTIQEVFMDEPEDQLMAISERVGLLYGGSGC